jgi:hypothetical protein
MQKCAAAWPSASTVADRGGQAGLRHGQPLRRGHRQVQVAAQRVGQQPGHLAGAVLGGIPLGGHEVGPFGGHPLAGLRRAGEGDRRDVVGGGLAGDAGDGREREQRGAVGAAQVEVQQAVHGRVAVGGQQAGGEHRGVLQEQVVAGVAVGGGGPDQVQAGERLQQFAGLGASDTGQGGGRVRGPAGGRGHEAEQAEEALRRRREHAVRQVEGAPDGGPLVAGHPQLGQPGEFAGVVAQRGVRPVGEAARRDAQGQWEVSAEPRQLRSPGRVGVHGGLPGGVGEHAYGVGRRQDVEREAPRPVQRDEAAEPVAAGGQDEAAGAAGQQWPHLFRVADVVEHDQAAAVRQGRAVAGALGVDADGDLVGRYAERLQHLRQRVGRGHAGGPVEAAHVEEQLPVREARGGAVRPVHGEGGLAGPGGAGHEHQPVRPVPEGVQLGDLGVPPDKSGGVGRQLPVDRGGAGRRTVRERRRRAGAVAAAAAPATVRGPARRRAGGAGPGRPAARHPAGRCGAGPA